MKQGTKHKITYGMPAEVAAGRTFLRVLDHFGCTLEGLYKIETYTEQKLCVQVSWGNIHFFGEKFCIEQMDGTVLSFTGNIERIEYMA